MHDITTLFHASCFIDLNSKSGVVLVQSAGSSNAGVARILRLSNQTGRFNSNEATSAKLGDLKCQERQELEVSEDLFFEGSEHQY